MAATGRPDCRKMVSFKLREAPADVEPHVVKIAVVLLNLKELLEGQVEGQTSWVRF